MEKKSPDQQTRRWNVCRSISERQTSMCYQFCVYSSISLQNASFDGKALELTVEHIPNFVARLERRTTKYGWFAVQYEVTHSCVFHNCWAIGLCRSPLEYYMKAETRRHAKPHSAFRRQTISERWTGVWEHIVLTEQKPNYCQTSW
jgi:hypothetical protein